MACAAGRRGWTSAACATATASTSAATACASAWRRGTAWASAGAARVRRSSAPAPRILSQREGPLMDAQTTPYRAHVQGLREKSSRVPHACPLRSHPAALMPLLIAAVIDDCGVCNGMNKDVGCDGMCFSGGRVDCNGVCNGPNMPDDCGVCGGTNEDKGCDGACFSRKKPDCMGTCGGNAGAECPPRVSPAVSTGPFYSGMREQ